MQILQKHWTHIFTHLNKHKQTLRIIISRSCCHWLILQETSEIQLWSEQWTKKTKQKDNYDYHTCLQHSFLLFSGRTPILIPTDRQESQHRLTWNELWAVNATTELIMMMIVIKMMITADGGRKKKEKKTTKQLCSRPVFIGQCWPISHAPWQRLTKTTNIVFIIIIIMVAAILTCLQRLSARYYHP